MPSRVLYVEDDPLLRRGMIALVTALGHEVIVAGSIGEAMGRLDSNLTHLLLDMNLPDGLGTAILRHVRDERLPIRVAVLSGSSDTALMAEVRSLNPDTLFSKPPDWDAVMDWLAV